MVRIRVRVRSRVRVDVSGFMVSGLGSWFRVYGLGFRV